MQRVARNFVQTTKDMLQQILASYKTQNTEIVQKNHNDLFPSILDTSILDKGSNAEKEKQKIGKVNGRRDDNICNGS